MNAEEDDFLLQSNSVLYRQGLSEPIFYKHIEPEASFFL
jgi:predicted DNA-binding transcriptional regulator AlpA